VIYTELHQRPETIARIAVEEDVDVVALSVLSGAHRTLFPRAQEFLGAEGVCDVLVTGGGIIPEEGAAELGRLGISRLFGPGTPTSEAVEYVRAWYRENREASPT